MDLAIGSAVDIVQLAALIGIPGLSIVLVSRGPKTLMRVIVYGASISILYLILISALLLHFGVFNINALLVTTLVPALIPVARWRHASHRLRTMKLGAYTLIPCMLVGGSMLLLLLVLTPRWNFLVAPNMDAGNYELYGNHFWKIGSFYLDGGNLLDRGAEPSWLASHNTWNFDPASELGRPSYLPAYPILLGIVKATFDSAVASPLINALLSSLSAILMVLIGLQVVRARLLVVSIVTGLVLTPMFFYYGKQFMSEQLGLLGILVVVHALLESRGLVPDPDDESSTSVATIGLMVGISLGVLSRLDFLPVMALLVAGLLVLEFDSWARRNRAMPMFFYAWPAATGFGALAVVAALGHPTYLRHAMPEMVEGIFNPRVFLHVYGVTTGLAFLLVGVLPMALQRLEQSMPRRTIIKTGQVVAVLVSAAWAVFVLWNLVLRPMDADPASATRDAENLIRLFTVTSPFILGATLVVSPLILMLKRFERGVVVMLIAGFGLTIYASRHSPPDVWWMRRYLLYIVPLGLVALAGMGSLLRSRFATKRFPIVQTMAALLVVVGAVGAWNMRPLFAAEVNPDVPRRMAQLMRAVPTGSLVVVPEGNALVRGLANTYRSLTGQPVLVDVAQEDLKLATELAQPDQDVVILSSAPLPQSLIETLELDDGNRQGTIERQWSNWLAEIYANPRPSKAFHYVIYGSSARNSYVGETTEG